MKDKREDGVGRKRRRENIIMEDVLEVALER